VDAAFTFKRPSSPSEIIPLLMAASRRCASDPFWANQPAQLVADVHDLVDADAASIPGVIALLASDAR
jgi:hypothetical protein